MIQFPSTEKHMHIPFLGKPLSLRENNESSPYLLYKNYEVQLQFFGGQISFRR